MAAKKATKRAGKATGKANGGGKYVLVRTTGAGVHVGRLVSRDGDAVTLTDARRLWRWKGANTLHEVALSGVDDTYSRISEPVTEITVLGCHEVITLAEAARENLTRSRWGA